MVFLFWLLSYATLHCLCLGTRSKQFRRVLSVMLAAGKYSIHHGVGYFSLLTETGVCTVGCVDRVRS